MYKMKTLSIIIPIYNTSKEYFSKCLTSLICDQSYEIEVIVVDDGSLEKYSIEIEKEIKDSPLDIQYYKKENGGQNSAREYGLLIASGKYIFFMDSDDYVVNTRCERQLEKFQEDPRLGIVGSYEAEFVDDVENVISIHRVPTEDGEIEQFMHRRCSILHPTVMYKKSAVLKSGNYQSVLLYEDYDLFARMVLEHHIKSYNIPESLYYIRTSEDFFKRRGGMKYAKTVLQFKWGQYKKGYMSAVDFCISGLGQAFVCLLPNVLRKSFYMKFLRKWLKSRYEYGRSN